MLDHLQSRNDNKNVLIVLTDQQRYDCVGYVDNKIKTPNIDRLAKSGIICTNTFVQSPQCQPSRASIMTGRYPTAHKVWWNETILPKTEKTIANILRDNGYSTAYFGKLHFDGIDDHTRTANHFGYDETFLFQDWQRTISSKNSKLKKKNAIEKEFYGPMNVHTWTGEFKTKEDHHEEIITNKAIEYIEKTKNKPWFVTIGFHGPHPPYASPDEFSSLYKDTNISIPDTPVISHLGKILSDDEWRNLKIQYYGSISWIDSCVGRLLNSIDTNTIVVYTSDHGDILGDHGLFSKGIYAYDGNVKVPLLFGNIGVVGKYDYLVQSIDIVPTILNVLNLPVPIGIQGKNILNGLLNNKSVNDTAGCMIGYENRLRMVINSSYKYWICDDNEFLFKIGNESSNLIKQKPEILSLMRLELLKFLIKAEDVLPQPTGH